MSQNPYEPPRAGVTDDLVAEFPRRPRAVNVALGLIGGAALIQVLTSLRSLQEMQFQIDDARGLTINAVRFIVLGLICHQIARRKSWPRMVLLLLTLVNFAQTSWIVGRAVKILTGDNLREILPQFLGVQVLPLAMNLVALHLLYFSSGKWFR